jgi:hypothetical protein
MNKDNFIRPSDLDDPTTKESLLGKEITLTFVNDDGSTIGNAKGTIAGFTDTKNE